MASMSLTMTYSATALNPPPSPLKRTLPDDCLPGRDDETDWRRKRRKPDRVVHRLAHLQPGADILAYSPQDSSVVDAYLTRTISAALLAAGFDGARRSAVESFRASIEEYISSFLATVSESMTSCRRTAPIPQDFILALARASLSSSSLKPHLKPVIPMSIVQPPILPPPPLENNPDFPFPSDHDNFATFLKTDEPSQEPETQPERRHIPSSLPSFPSDHTWKSTPVLIERDCDPVKLREQSRKEGHLAEKALRRLMFARQRGLGLTVSLADSSDSSDAHDDEKPLKLLKHNKHRVAKKDPLLAQWEDSMKAMMAFDEEAIAESNKKLDVAVVQSKSSSKAPEPPPPLPGLDEGDLSKPAPEDDILMMDLGSVDKTAGFFSNEFDDMDDLGFDDHDGDAIGFDIDMDGDGADGTGDGIGTDLGTGTGKTGSIMKPFDRPGPQTVDMGMVVNHEQKYWRVGSSSVS